MKMKDKSLSIILVAVCVFCMTSDTFAKLELKLKEKNKTNELNKTEVSFVFTDLLYNVRIQGSRSWVIGQGQRDEKHHFLSSRWNACEVINIIL